MNAPDSKPIRLTSLSHGGGCGCKIAPALLEQIIARSAGGPPAERAAGRHRDQRRRGRVPDQRVAGHRRDHRLLHADRRRPLRLRCHRRHQRHLRRVRDGRHAAASRSPSSACRSSTLPVETIRRILEGGESVCARAGIPVAGGHSIDSVEPIYGLVAIGLVHPKHVKRNADARPGDKLVLGKPLGVGIYSAALKKEQLDDAGYRAMIACTTRLNTPGPQARTARRRARADRRDRLRPARPSARGVQGIEGRPPPSTGTGCRCCPVCASLCAQGHKTGGSGRNWAGYGQRRWISAGYGEVEQALLTDPQTSGGLAGRLRAGAVDQVLEIFRADGFEHAAVIGEIAAGEPGVKVI